MVTKRRNYTKRRKPKTNRRNTKRHTKRRHTKRRNIKKRKISKKSNKILIQEGGMETAKAIATTAMNTAKKCLPCLDRGGDGGPQVVHVGPAPERENTPMVMANAPTATPTAAGATAASASPPEMTGSKRKDLEMLAKKLEINVKDYKDDRKLELILNILQADYHFSGRDPVPRRVPPTLTTRSRPYAVVEKDPILDYAEKTADMIIANPDISEETLRAVAKSEIMEVLEDRVDYPLKLKSELLDRYHEAIRKKEGAQKSSRLPFYHSLNSPEPEPEPSDALRAFVRDQKAETASKERMCRRDSREAWIEKNRAKRESASAGENKRGNTSANF